MARRAGAGHQTNLTSALELDAVRHIGSPGSSGSPRLQNSPKLLRRARILEEGLVSAKDMQLASPKQVDRGTHALHQLTQNWLSWYAATASRAASGCPSDPMATTK